MRAKCYGCGNYNKLHYKQYRTIIKCYRCGREMQVTMSPYEKYLLIQNRKKKRF